MRKKLIFQGYRYTLLVLLCTLFSSSLFGQTSVWTNGGGDNLWSNAANWSTGSVPNSTKGALFDNTSTDNCILTANINTTRITIDSNYTGQLSLGSYDVGLVNGIFIDNPAQLDAGTSTIKFTTNSAIINSAAAFYNLEFNKSGLFRITLMQNITVNNDLKIQNVYTIRGDTIFVLGDLITNDAQWIYDNIPTTIISLAGSTDQTISGSGSLHGLDIQKTGGDVLLSSDVKLSYGSLTGSGSIKNVGGKFVARNKAVFDFSGTIDDLEYQVWTQNISIYFYQDLIVNNDLTISNAVNVNGVNGYGPIVSGDVITTSPSSYTGSSYIKFTGTGDHTISGTGNVGNLLIDQLNGNVFFGAGFSKNFKVVIIKGYEWDLNGETITATSFIVRDGGIIKSLGTLNGNLIIEDGGTLNTGNSPVCQTITGHYTLKTGGTHSVKLNGTNACTEYDQLQVSGYVYLQGGDLDIQIGNSYSPINATNHNILIAPSTFVSGTFGSVNTNAPYSATATKTYSNTRVTINVTPPVFFDVDFAASPVCASATEWLVPITVGAAPSDIGAVSLLFDYDATKMTYADIHSFHSNLSGADATNTGSLFVTDNNGKIAISWIGYSGATATLSNDTIITLRFIPANSAADFTAAAGTTADFTWDNSTTDNNEFADDMATVMNITFNDQSGASIQALLTPGLSSDKANDEICAGETITFTATGGTTYEFFVDNVSQGAASATATFASSTLTNGQVVTVEVTDANGCLAISSGVTVTVNPLPTAGLSSDKTNDEICAGETITFTATGGATYEFFVDNVSQGAASATATFASSTLTNGQVVTVEVTNAGGCSATSTGVTVTVNPAPTAGLSSDKTNDEICGGETITFTATGGTTYEFFVDNVSQGAASATATFTSSTLTNGQIVTVEVTNANGCSATSTGVTVTVNAAPTAGLSSDKTNDEVCDGETITFTATGGTTYRFLVDGTEVQAASADDTYDTDALTGGETVTVEVTNANGCSATSTGVTVTVNALPTPSLASSDADDEICVGESVTFTASGADEYIFQVDGTEEQAQSATATYTTTSLTDGQVVTVIGVNTTTGCQAASTTTFTMTVIPCYEYSGEMVYKNTDETKMGNVVLTLTEAGGATYTMTTSVTTGSIGSFSFTDLPSGSYTLTSTNTKTHGGINSTDAYRTILHAITLSPLTGINEIAADVNGDGSETAIDALAIQRRFVDLDSSFTAGDWAFGNPTFTLSSDLTNQKIYTLAMGDVNGNYTPNSTESFQSTVFFVDGDNMEINNGDNVTIPVRITKATTVGAISLAINYDGMTINNITLPNGQTVIYNAVNGEVRISWVDIAALNLANNDILFNIDATINDVATVMNNTMTLNAISEIADDNANPYELFDLVLPTFSTMSTNTNNIAEEALSVRHFPNPFSDFVTIQYDLPTTSDVTITVTNALGVQVRNLIQATQVAGQQQVRFEAHDLTSGMYFYTITANDGNKQYQTTKQLMLIK